MDNTVESRIALISSTPSTVDARKHSWRQSLGVVQLTSSGVSFSMGGVVSTLDGTTGMFALMANAVVMNLLQLAAYGVITPFSRDAFRRLNW